MIREPHVLLAFPPAFYPHMPYLALPSLAAELGKRGLSHSQLDLNVLFYEAILQRSFVERCWNHIKTHVSTASSDSVGFRRLTLTTHPAIAEIIPLIPAAVGAIRRTRTGLDPRVDPWRVLNLALDIVSDAHLPEIITFSRYEGRRLRESTTAVLQAVEERDRSIFHAPVMAVLRAEIERQCPQVLAISITVPDQIIPAFGLLASVREEFPELRILLGGSIPTRLSDVFRRAGPLSFYYDGIVLGEADHVITNAVRSLVDTNNHRATGVPRIVDVDPTKASVESLATPDFDGLPLALYFDGQLILPLLASRRCYYGKCLFCDIPASYAPAHRARRPEQIVDDMHTLASRYNTRFIKFTDDALSPNLLKHIATELIRRGLDLRWEAYVRLEAPFASPAFAELLYRAGCRWLYFGLETGSEATALKMEKPNSLRRTAEILKAVSQAGIRLHVWIIVGFPTETRDDVTRSVDFVVSHGRHIDSVEVNQFALTRLAPIMSPEVLRRLGVTPRIRPEDDLALLYDYDVVTGLSQEESRALTHEVRDTIQRELGIPDVVRSSQLCFDDDAAAVHRPTTQNAAALACTLTEDSHETSIHDDRSGPDLRRDNLPVLQQG